MKIRIIIIILLVGICVYLWQANRTTLDVNKKIYIQNRTSDKPMNIYYPTTKRFPYIITGFHVWEPKTLEKLYNQVDTDTFNYAQPSFEFEEFQDLANKTVADVGAGTGKNLLYWQYRIGMGGKIILTDVCPNVCRFMAYLAGKDSKFKKIKRNITIIQNRMNNACLPANSIDLILCESLHLWITSGLWQRYPELPNEFDYPTFLKNAYIFHRSLYQALKPGGRLVITDFVQAKNRLCKNGNNMIYITSEEAIKNIERAGFKKVKYIYRQHPELWGVVFEKRKKENNEKRN